MLRLIFLFLVIVTRIHTNYLANQKNNPKMKNNIMFICMYVCMYICMETRNNSELRTFLVHNYSFKCRIYF